MRKRIFLCLLLFSSFSCLAQTADSVHMPTRADSLRGFLSPLRTCFDVVYYHLDVKIETERKFISGKNTIRFRAVRNLSDLQLDLFSNMAAEKILFQGQPLSFKREYNAVFVHFPRSLKKDSLYTLDFYYSGFPKIAVNPPWDGGFDWKLDSLGNPWIGVSCQGIGASLWWPNKDSQSDEPDSMLITAHVPRGLMDVSNGRLIRTSADSSGYTRYDWLVRSPINNYDVTLNIGKYAAFSDHFGNMTMEYYVLPYHLEQAKKHFRQVNLMLGCFSNYFGPYPFKRDGYKLVETDYLGMENQSAISYGNLFMNGYRGEDLSGTGNGLSWDYIIVHESAHEWFGNNITSADIADMWVHEAFATYAESLYVECRYGYEKGQQYVIGQRKNVRNDRPCIGRFGINDEGSEDMYFKGANMLNTIRHVIANDSLWFACLRSLNSSFRHQVVSGRQVVDFICRHTRTNLKPVFEQYLAHAAIPVLELRYPAEGRQVQYRWVCDVADFKMPMSLLINNKPALIHPLSQHWTTLILQPGITRDQIKADTDSFYVNVQTDK